MRLLLASSIFINLILSCSSTLLNSASEADVEEEDAFFFNVRASMSMSVQYINTPTKQPSNLRPTSSPRSDHSAKPANQPLTKKPRPSPVQKSSSNPTSAPSNTTTSDEPPDSSSSKPTHPPLTKKPRSKPVRTSSSKPTSAQSNMTTTSTQLLSLIYYLMQKGSSIVINKELLSGMELDFLPAGSRPSIGDGGGTTKVPYIYDNTTLPETIIIKGGNLPTIDAEVVLWVGNSMGITLNQVGSHIVIRGRISSGATITYHNDSSADVTVGTPIPFLYKEVDVNTTLVRGGNLPKDYVIQISTYITDAAPADTN